MSADLHLAEQNQQEEAPVCKCAISISYHGSICGRGEINDDVEDQKTDGWRRERRQSVLGSLNDV